MKISRKNMLLSTLLMGLAILLIAGCSSNNNGDKDSEGSANNGEKPVLQYVSPGSEPWDHEQRQAAVNKALAEDGYNFEINAQYIGWDVWDQKTNLMLSTNDQIDIMTTMEDLTKTSVFAGRGAILPIGEYLDDNPDLKSKFPDYVWNNIKVNGEIYSIPVFNREWASDYELITYRKDLFEKYDLEIPETQQDMIEAMEIVSEAENMNPLFVTKQNVILHNIHREYDSYPFTVIDDLIYIDSDGNVKSWMETEEFKQDWEFARQMYTKGFIHPDILTLTIDQAFSLGGEGNFLFFIGNQIGMEQNIKTFAPEAEVDVFRLAPDAPWMRPLLHNNANVIPKTSKYPAQAVQFFDWLYKSQENYDLFTYGIEGENWNDLGDGMMELIDPDPNKIQFAEWKIGFHEYLRYRPNDHPKLRETQEINDRAVNAPDVGFSFNTEPVSVEYSNLLAEIKTTLYPLKFGVVEWDNAYSAALSRMKSAGLDKVVDEYAKQFKEWNDNK